MITEAVTVPVGLQFTCRLALTQWTNRFPFNYKIAPRKCTKTRLFKLKNREKKFSGGGTAPSSGLYPSGEGDTPSPHPTRALSSRAYGARPPAFPVSPPDLGVLAETLASYLETQPL